jgi:hypothetical protein
LVDGTPASCAGGKAMSHASGRVLAQRTDFIGKGNWADEDMAPVVERTIMALQGTRPAGEFHTEEDKLVESSLGLGSEGPVVSLKVPLSFALLRRPPFAFVHAVILSVFDVTGFGVLTFEEQDPAFPRHSSREDRVAFLTKLCALVDFVVEDADRAARAGNADAQEALAHATCAVTRAAQRGGADNRKGSVEADWAAQWVPVLVLVTPTKVLAGREPERTNALLQKLAIGARLHREDHARSARGVRYVEAAGAAKLYFGSCRTRVNLAMLQSRWRGRAARALRTKREAERSGLQRRQQQLQQQHSPPQQQQQPSSQAAVAAAAALPGRRDAAGQQGGAGGRLLAVGTTFMKHFEGYGEFRGVVTASSVQNGRQLYTCFYEEDGDEEELTGAELHELLLRDASGNEARRRRQEQQRQQGEEEEEEENLAGADAGGGGDRAAGWGAAAGQAAAAVAADGAQGYDATMLLGFGGEEGQQGAGALVLPQLSCMPQLQMSTTRAHGSAAAALHGGRSALLSTSLPAGSAVRGQPTDPHGQGDARFNAYSKPAPGAKRGKRRGRQQQAPPPQLQVSRSLEQLGGVGSKPMTADEEEQAWQMAQQKRQQDLVAHRQHQRVEQKRRLLLRKKKAKTKKAPKGGSGARSAQQLSSDPFGFDEPSFLHGGPGPPTLPGLSVPGGVDAWRERLRPIDPEERARVKKRAAAAVAATMSASIASMASHAGQAGFSVPAPIKATEDGFRMTLPLTAVEAMLCKLMSLRDVGALDRAFLLLLGREAPRQQRRRHRAGAGVPRDARVPVKALMLELRGECERAARAAEEKHPRELPSLSPHRGGAGGGGAVDPSRLLLPITRNEQTLLVDMVAGICGEDASTVLAGVTYQQLARSLKGLPPPPANWQDGMAQSASPSKGRSAAAAAQAADLAAVHAAASATDEDLRAIAAPPSEAADVDRALANAKKQAERLAQLMTKSGIKPTAAGAITRSFLMRMAPDQREAYAAEHKAEAATKQRLRAKLGIAEVNLLGGAAMPSTGASPMAASNASPGKPEGASGQGRSLSSAYSAGLKSVRSGLARGGFQGPIAEEEEEQGAGEEEEEEGGARAGGGAGGGGDGGGAFLDQFMALGAAEQEAAVQTSAAAVKAAVQAPATSTAVAPQPKPVTRAEKEADAAAAAAEAQWRADKEAKAKVKAAAQEEQEAAAEAKAAAEARSAATEAKRVATEAEAKAAAQAAVLDSDNAYSDDGFDASHGIATEAAGASAPKTDENAADSSDGGYSDDEEHFDSPEPSPVKATTPATSAAAQETVAQKEEEEEAYSSDEGYGSDDFD